MRYYECGNYSQYDDPTEYCKFCGAEQREPPDQYGTVVITCDGWY